MDTQKRDLLEAILQAAGGEIVGRIRFQKIVYLLDQAGMKSGLQFSYYHYGPYSEELARALDMESMSGRRLREDQGTTQSGYKFSIFRSIKSTPEVESLGTLPIETAHDLIAKMKEPSSTVIELAATIHWLQKKEKVRDWPKELKIRKGSKADNERTEQALALLKEIGLL